ncbi:MAG: hypothetical protein HRU26_13930 [Psychroserpens sp.]|nr:hypothetical protein [Psychroserpens sp.]
MNESENQIVREIIKSENLSFLVTILELSAAKTGVDTVSEVARRNGISPNGVKSSKRYRKVRIGKQLMAIKGLDDLALPF